MATGYDLGDVGVQRFSTDSTVAWACGDADSATVEELHLSQKLVAFVGGVRSHLGVERPSMSELVRL